MLCGSSCGSSVRTRRGGKSAMVICFVSTSQVLIEFVDLASNRTCFLYEARVTFFFRSGFPFLFSVPLAELVDENMVTLGTICSVCCMFLL